MKIVGRVFVCAALLSLSLPVNAQQNWPSKPVKIIIPNAASSAPDFVGRMLSEILARATGQTWIVENRPGGQGIIAADAAAKSAPDGYTFFIAGSESLVLAPRLLKYVPYDPVRDFAPVAVLIDTAGIAIVVRSELRAENLRELILLAKAQPGKLTYGTNVKFPEMLGIWLKKRAGIEMVHVPYKGIAQGLQDILGNRVDCLITALPALDRHIKAGKLRVLAVSSATRMPDWSSVETVGETFPGFSLTGWLVFTVPAGTPAEIVQRANRETNAVIKSPEFVQKVSQYGWYNNHGPRSSQEAVDFVRGERERWYKFLDEIDIQPE